MKLALIPPIPYVWYAQYCKTHLILSHLIDDTVHGKHYTRFYNQLGSDHYTILDNGAHELPQGESLLETLRKADVLGGVDEIVMPDRQQDSGATIAAVSGAIEVLRDPMGQAAYELAGKPRLMYVPQATTMEEWRRCANTLYHKHMKMMTDGVVQSWPVFGIAKKHARHFEYANILAYCRGGKLETHALGLPEGVPISHLQRFGVRSLDTAKPFVYAIDRTFMGDTGKMLHRQEGYFHKAWDVDRSLLRENIEYLQLRVEGQHG